MIKLTYKIFLAIITILLSSCTDFIVPIDKQEEWLTNKSDNIILHYRSPDYSSSISPTEEISKQIVSDQNYYFSTIQDSIQRQFNNRVLIYLYNKDEAEEFIGTNSGGHSIPKLHCFYYTYLPDKPDYTDQYGIENPYLGAHELVHVITHRCLGYPGTKMMSEGYAVWLDGSYGGNDIKDIMIHYRDNEPEKILSPTQLLNETTEIEAIYYPNAGTFIKFLVSRYNIENINTLFTIRENDFISRFYQHTATDWQDMSDKYFNYVDNLCKN